MNKKANYIFSAFIAVALASCSSGEEAQQQAATQAPAGYKTLTVAKSDKTVSETYSATIRGCQDIDILPQVSGKIERLCVSEGQVVRNGQLLFVIDQVPYRAALKTAEANMEVAKADLATAELNLNNSRMLNEKNVVSNSNLQTVENAFLSAKARLAQAEAQLVNAQNNLSYTEVKAPCNGVVGTLPYRVGTLVSPSMMQPLTTISDNSKMYVYFSMTENQLLSYTRKYGSMAETLKNMPEIELRLNDGSVYDQKGKIETISGVIDPQTGSVSARAEFDNTGRILHSGASGTVVLPYTYTDCIVIPQEATMKMQNKVLVYKVVEGKAVSQIIDVVNISDGREYIVTGGIEVGDEIVAEGVGLIREGTQVK
ncbi:MAG: efflux RND transporter periplasmic adaptor subunit [Muribaculaceae bacterium]